MKRQMMTAVTSMVVGVAVSGCGGNSAAPSAYCTSLADAEPAFRAMASGDIESFDRTFSVFHDLADQTPEAIRPEWRTVDGAFVTFEEGLAGVGLDLSDFDDVVSQGDIPPGVDPQQLQELMTELEQLGSADFAKAASTIERHALDECGVDLS